MPQKKKETERDISENIARNILTKGLFLSFETHFIL